MDTRTKYALSVALPLGLVALDRLLKWYALAAPPSDGGAVLLSWIGFGYFQNQGLVFSLFSPLTALLASAFAYMALAFIALHRRFAGIRLTSRDRWEFMLIAAGGASNIYDRLAHGGVVDYLIFFRSAWNIADIMILAGIVLMVVHVKDAKASASVPRG